MSTQTQVALITGLAADLAIEIARILSERGFHLIVTETSESMMSLARDKLNGSVAPSDAFILDVCASADWDCAMDRACRKFGVPSLVFNLQSWSQNTEAAHEDAEICILGNYYGLHAAIPRMI
ncbi:MAG: hypothetical protein KGO02_20855, partial [Alphaproteobacteria bacterium]|nr:hypothetical protein [Alphaproteobacteria bacterium]